jgi:serpin B
MVILAVAGATCALAACGTPTGREVRGDAATATPDARTIDGGVAAVNTFAIDLEHAVAERGGNVAIAPYPVARTLAMARLGARTDTRAAFDSVLHADLSEDLDASFTAIDGLLVEREGNRRSATRKGEIELDLPSALWAQEEIRFTPAFLNDLARFYGTGVRVVDFRSDPSEARHGINRWATAETRGAVDLLVPRGEVSDFTRLIPASAATMHAPWAARFDPEATSASTFALLDGRRVDSAAMTVRDTGTIRSSRGEGWQAVELPYLGGELAMLLVVPDAGRFDMIASGFSRDQLTEVIDTLTPSPIELRIPRFQFASVTTLDDPLSALGLGDAFSTVRADFSGLTNEESLTISDVVHGTYVAADEEGSDGDAVTVVPPAATFEPTAAVAVDVDRPFLFVVRDTLTGLILQMGRVLEPQT